MNSINIIKYREKTSKFEFEFETLRRSIYRAS